MTGKKRYLRLAEKAIICLEEHGEIQKQGMGWKIKKDIPPMSGMAHGNSGILMPVFSLWKMTGKERYERLSEEIWRYEESLFDVEAGNWIDVRDSIKEQEGVGAVAWCHGAAGILLSRLYCSALAEEELWKERFETDIGRAYKVLKKYWKRDSWSLCHGICGNLWILELAERGRKEFSVYDCLNQSEYLKLMPQEVLNPGFMNGYGGVVYWLLKVAT